MTASSERPPGPPSDVSSRGWRARDGRALPRLHVVTDESVLGGEDFPARAAAVLEVGGPRVALHLRGRRTPGRTLYDLAERLRERARAAGACLLVNDRVDVALALALGAHLGSRSLPPEEARRLLGEDALVGVSVHGREEAEAAAGAGADYLVVGTVFATRSHPGRPPAGPSLVQEVASAVDVPVLAIGGVTPERVGEVTAAGAWGVAVLSGVWGGHPTTAVERFLAALDAEEEG